MHDVGDYILNQMGGRKNNLTPCSQLSQETLWPYQAFVNHIMQKSKSSENSSPGCKMSLWHLLHRRPHPCDKKMLPLSAFEEDLGTSLTTPPLLLFGRCDIFDLWLIKLVEPLHPFLYVFCYCNKWKVVIFCVQSTVSNNEYIEACKHAQSLVASSRLHNTEFHT